MKYYSKKLIIYNASIDYLFVVYNNLKKLHKKYYYRFIQSIKNYPNYWYMLNDDCHEYLNKNVIIYLVLKKL